MNRNAWTKAGLGAGAIALIAAMAIAATSPAFAQGALLVGPAAGAPIVAQHGGGPFGRGGGRADMATVATALGVTEAELRTELQAGKSIADVARAKGVDVQKVIDAVITAQTESLSQAVTAGRFTQAQADTLLANLRLTLPSQLQTKWVGFGPGTGEPGIGRGGRGDRGMGHGGIGGASLTTIATALGVAEADLRTELQAGKSIADVASEKGVALQTVVDAVIAGQTTALSQAVANGRITQAQADAMLAQARANLPNLLELKGGFAFGGRGLGGGKWPGAPNTAPAATPGPTT
jgi:hypothetical protein